MQRRRFINAFALSAAAIGLGLAWSAQAADTIKVGILSSLSGTMAISETPLKDVALMTIDEINARGGLLDGRQVVLVRRDDEGNPAKGMAAARELIYKEKVAV
ncbi:urea ABC transporter substrate-binding protein, partial [Klebsiella pneumoniae]|uniref:ABC transporter substrate-binding protein n=1 Tax=Klebsiella pneumoniae TaxID=573 RepID=UPI0015F83320